MIRGILVVLMLTIASGCGGTRKPEPAFQQNSTAQRTKSHPDQELLQGKWAMISFEQDERKAKNVAKGRVIIKGVELTLGGDGEVGETFTFELFPADTPKGIKLSTPAEPKAPTAGIYKLEGDSLTLCIRGRGGRKKDGTPLDPSELTRPVAFSSEGGNMLLVLSRIKP